MIDQILALEGNDGNEEVTENQPEASVDEACPNLPSTADNFLSVVESLDDYTTTVPNTLTASILSRAGMDTADQRMVTLVSLAAQKFISDLASDALTHRKMRQASSNHIKKGNKEKKYAMTTDDLAIALQDKGIAVKKPPYH